MGKSPVNTALGVVHGKIDDWVYRRVEGEVVIARRPRRTDTDPTLPQQEVRRIFREAADYARAVYQDPVRKQSYLDVALRRGFPTSRLFAFIVQDYAKGPEVTRINVEYYHRQIGDAVRVYAEDNGEVTGVTVALKAADGTVIESGPAVKVDAYWRYTATTLVPAGDVVTIEATAMDRAENKGVKTLVVT